VPGRTLIWRAAAPLRRRGFRDTSANARSRGAQRDAGCADTITCNGMRKQHRFASRQRGIAAKASIDNKYGGRRGMMYNLPHTGQHSTTIPENAAHAERRRSHLVAAEGVEPPRKEHACWRKTILPANAASGGSGRHCWRTDAAWRAGGAL